MNTIRVEIKDAGLAVPQTYVTVDGLDIKGIREMHVRHLAGELPEVTLVLLGEVTMASEFSGDVETNVVDVTTFNSIEQDGGLRRFAKVPE